MFTLTSNPVSWPGLTHPVSQPGQTQVMVFTLLWLYMVHLYRILNHFKMSIQARYLSLLSFEGKMKTYICVYLLTVNC
jgi:hypothetical protein